MGPSSSPTLSLRVVALLLLVICVALYLPFVGRGFYKDDFSWILRSRVDSLDGLAILLKASSGFFRPVVSASFAANWWACGVNSHCYGATNFALLLGCAAGVFFLSKQLKLSDGAALCAAALWIFNWHGINVSVYWISGRTELLLVMFATFAAAAFIAGRVVVGWVLCLLAMLSKEEGIALPFLFLSWSLLQLWATGRNRTTTRHVLTATIAALAVTISYFYIRLLSGAFTRSSAPAYYQLSFTASRLLANTASYLDRSVSCSGLVLLLFFLLCRTAPQWSPFGRSRAQLLAFCVLWWVGGFAITAFLPIRSSLYALLPSVGIVTIASALAEDTWANIGAVAKRRAQIAGILLPAFLAWPVHHARSVRLIRQGELSSRVVEALRQQAALRGEGTRVILLDDRSVKPSLDDTFGTAVQDASNLLVTPHVFVQIDPPPVDAELAGLPPIGRYDVKLALRNGDVVESQ